MHPELYHFIPLSRQEAEEFLPLAEAAGGMAATDMMMRMRYADCLLALGNTDQAEKIYEDLVRQDVWFLPAHAALLYLQVQHQPELVAAINLPLRLRKIYDFPMLVWYAFPDSDLEMQQKPYFNRLLGLLAKLLHTRISDLTALDIGANIGQSVAEVQYHAPIPCLSIECGPQNFALTQYNVSRLNLNNKALHALVGIDGQYGKMNYVKQFPGFENAAAPEWIQPDRADSTDAGAVPAKPLMQLLDTAPEFKNSRMVKIDAEGWDWDIISGNAEFWRKNQPWLFYENNPEFFKDWREGNACSIGAMQTLIEAGYQDFMIFDHEGRYLGQVSDNHAARMHELNAFHTLHRRTGGCIGHYDILAVPAAEAGWIPDLLADMFPPDLYGRAA